MKQQPTRLTEAERQARRQHQIDLGKATQGYRNLCVLRANGVIPHGPVTPDPAVKNVSKRQFDKEIREWRRKLHAFDNVDFNNLKSKIFKHRNEEADYLNMLLGKEIRDVVQREMMFREQQAAAASAAKMSPDYGLSNWRRDSSVAPSSVSSEGLRSSRSAWPSASPEPVKRIIIENDVLRLKVQELQYQNNALLERLHQQDMLIRSFVDADMESERMDFYERCGPVASAGAEESNWIYPPQAV